MNISEFLQMIQKYPSELKIVYIDDRKIKPIVSVLFGPEGFRLYTDSDAPDLRYGLILDQLIKLMASVQSIVPGMEEGKVYLGKDPIMGVAEHFAYMQYPHPITFLELHSRQFIN